MQKNEVSVNSTPNAREQAGYARSDAYKNVRLVDFHSPRIQPENVIGTHGYAPASFYSKGPAVVSLAGSCGDLRRLAVG
jgi:hypothetical protein